MNRRDLVQLLTVIAERNRRQNDWLATLRKRLTGCFDGKLLRLNHIGAVGQMKVMGFGGSPREDRDVGLVIEKLPVVGFM